MYAFISDEERDVEFALEEARIKVDRAMLYYEATCIQNDLKFREIENQMFVEDGDACDLTDAYMEAAQQAQQAEKGALRSIWDAIVNTIKTIIEKLFGKGAPQTQQMDSNEHKAMKKLKELSGNVKSFISNHKITTFVALVGTVLAIRKLRNKSGKMENVEGKEQEEAEGLIRTVINDINQWISDRKLKKNGDASSNSDTESDLTDNNSGEKESSVVNEAVNQMSWLQGVINKGKKAKDAVVNGAKNGVDKVKGKFGKGSNKQQDNQNATNNQQQQNNQNTNDQNAEQGGGGTSEQQTQTQQEQQSSTPTQPQDQNATNNQQQQNNQNGKKQQQK